MTALLKFTSQLFVILQEMLRECTFETFESSFPFLCTTTEDKTFLRDCYDEFVQHIRSFCLVCSRLFLSLLFFSDELVI